MNTSLLTPDYLVLMEKERALTRRALSALERNDSGDEWLAARDAYGSEIELAVKMGKVSPEQFDELVRASAAHGDEFRKALAARKPRRAWSGTGEFLFRPAPEVQPVAATADEEALFPSAERDRIRRDLSTMLSLPPAVRTSLSFDLRERIGKYISALTPLRERADHPRAQLYTGCLFYWNCKVTAIAGTDQERAAMNVFSIKTSRSNLILGYFSIAEYFLELYRKTGTGGPAEQELLAEVDSWMNALRARIKLVGVLKRLAESD